jgi:hypothetical protein
MRSRKGCSGRAETTEGELGVTDPAQSRDLLIARIHGPCDLQCRARVHERLGVVTSPQRQRRQRAKRAHLQRALAVGLHHAQARIQLATGAR